MRFTLIATTLTVFLSTAAYAASDAVATVNGVKIKKQTFDTYLKIIQNANSGHPVDPNLVLNEMIRIELLYQEALKKKIDKDPDVAVRAEIQRKELFANALLQKSDIAKPIPDEELKKIYDEKIKNANLSEYKARHILVKTEDEAKEIIAELDKGKSFEDLAKAKSIDPGSKDSGGNLEWFGPGQMVPEFSQAVASMQKGSYTRTPVKSQFGYHVIKLEDTRPATPPSFEDSKKQITAAIQRQHLNEYIEKLQKAAKIEVVGADKPAAKKESSKKK